MNARHVFRSSVLVAVFFSINKIIALARQIIIGRVFGVSPLLDAFNAAKFLEWLREYSVFREAIEEKYSDRGLVNIVLHG